MNAEQLVESVRKHAKTVLLPSVAQAIVDEMGAQESQPLFILHTGAFFGNEQDEWEVEAISQERVDDYCRERSSQHDPLYTIPPDAARRIAELEAQRDGLHEALLRVRHIVSLPPYGRREDIAQVVCDALGRES